MWLLSGQSREHNDQRRELAASDSEKAGNDLRLLPHAHMQKHLMADSALDAVSSNVRRRIDELIARNAVLL
jgi:hypothetical protein